MALATLPDLNPDPAVVEVELEAREADIELRPGTLTRMWTYNGSVPGPLLRAPKGGRLIVHFHNALSAPTTIHWHGLRVSAEMDGTPAVQSPVPPDGRFDYDLTLPDAGTFWYHPHVESSTQVGYGLYGAIVVEDESEPFLGDDLTLVLSDATLLENASLAPGDMDGWFGDYFGREGGEILVNGKPRPVIRARAGLAQRWRLINASRARYFHLRVPGANVIRVGGDGGLIASPQLDAELLLAPGERLDAMVTAQRPGVGRIPVTAQDIDRFHIGAVLVPAPILDLLVVDEPALETPIPVPETLRAIEPLDLSQALVRPIELMEKVVDGTAVLGINGQTFSEAPPMHAHVGTTEIWEVKNATGFDHPFHLHGFFFQVLDVDDQPWPVLEWKDTIHVPGAGKLRFAVRYDDRPGMWMYHCHILDHADLGMMGMLMVMRPHE